jgi:hypothetical protein
MRTETNTIEIYTFKEASSELKIRLENTLVMTMIYMSLIWKKEYQH